MKPRKKRALAIVGGLATATVASLLVLNAFQSNLVFYFDPSQVLAHEAPDGARFRLGGVVEQGSVQRAASTLDIHFQVTDGIKSVPVMYSGFLPDMFREGKGVVVHGRLDAAGVFQADQVLAKHDENYMPPEVAESLAKAQTVRAGAGSAAAVKPQRTGAEATVMTPRHAGADAAAAARVTTPEYTR